MGSAQAVAHRVAVAGAMAPRYAAMQLVDDGPRAEALVASGWI